MKINNLAINRQILILFLLSSLFFFCNSGFSQGVSVSETNSPPDPSAMLDVESTTKGFLPPRLTSSQRLAMQSPASGLLVFDTDFNALFVNTGEGWMRVDAGDKWIKDEDNNLTYNLGKVGIGVNYPEAELEINGQMRITGGDPGTGKVLTSDAEGTASWQHSPMSILGYSQSCGYESVYTTLNFIVNPAIISLTESARILINSTRGLGTTVGITTGAIDLYVCYRNTNGGNIISIGGGIFGLRLPANTRIPFSLSYSTQVLSPGTYEVGLCGLSPAPSQWNSNEYGCTTAMAFTLPASKSQNHQYQEFTFENLFGRETINQYDSGLQPDADATSNHVVPKSSVEEKIEQLRSENEIIKAQLNALMKMVETFSSNTSKEK